MPRDDLPGLAREEPVALRVVRLVRLDQGRASARQLPGIHLGVARHDHDTRSLVCSASQRRLVAGHDGGATPPFALVAYDHAAVGPAASRAAATDLARWRPVEASSTTITRSTKAGMVSRTPADELLLRCGREPPR